MRFGQNPKEAKRRGGLSYACHFDSSSFNFLSLFFGPSLIFSRRAIPHTLGESVTMPFHVQPFIFSVGKTLLPKSRSQVKKETLKKEHPEKLRTPGSMNNPASRSMQTLPTVPRPASARPSRCYSVTEKVKTFATGRTPFQSPRCSRDETALQCSLGFVRDYFCRRFIHFELRTHLLDLRSLLFELGCQFATVASNTSTLRLSLACLAASGTARAGWVAD